MFFYKADAGLPGSSGRPVLRMPADENMKQTPTVSGEFVHNVGDLQMNITNWGIVGSMPQSNYPMGDVPSAQYPAGSGIEYLFAAGIWVGAIRNGIPSVSTAYPEDEFRPIDAPGGAVHKSFEGAEGGRRLPADPDDDGDGKSDEDRLNGSDDDRDGKIDEDFAAIGNQMFTSEYEDYQPESELIWPEHRPLGIRIRQESYQWGEDMYNDLVGIRYTITNRTFDYLYEMFIGIYADLDAGPRDRGSYQMDDKVGYWEGKWCAPKGLAEYPVWLKLSYVFDADGDDGRTESYFGLLILGYTTSVSGLDSPRFPSYDVRAFRHFQGLLPYVNGGDPANDYQRYDAMSGQTIDEETDKQGDYRVLMTVGEFPYLEPGKSFVFDVAFVAGRDFDDMLDNAAVAKMIYDGITYDLDGRSSTGTGGNESPLAGPIDDLDPNLCDGIEQHLKAARGETLWANLDCEWEYAAFLDRDCFKQGQVNLSDYSTGVGGREGRLNWVTACAPTPPRMRVVPGHRSVAVLWDNLSEITPDPFSLIYDFEGYMVWRADDWKRPLGTNEMTGPSHDLWTLLETRDITNGVPPDNDFRHLESVGGWGYEPLGHIDPDELAAYREYFEEFFVIGDHDYDIPCPEGLTEDECDTIEAQERMRVGFHGGRRYYRYVDDTAIDGMHYFYSVVAQDHILRTGVPWRPGRYNSPATNFVYAVSSPGAKTPGEYDTREIYVVPNPVTADRMEYWALGPVNDDASGLKIEFRNLPRCKSRIRIYTIAGDLVQTIEHDGSGGDGSAAWNLVSRNGQDVTSGVYLFSVEPASERFERAVGKFVVVR